MQIPPWLTSAALAPSPLLSLQKKVFLEMLGKFCYSSKQSTEEGCQQQFSNLLPRLSHKLHPLRMACGQSTAWMSQLLWDTSYSKSKIKIILFFCLGVFKVTNMIFWILVFHTWNTYCPVVWLMIACLTFFQNLSKQRWCISRLPLSSVATSIKVPAERCSHNRPTCYI